MAEPAGPSAPAEFGLVQAWCGDDKGKTTAALGTGFRTAGRGFRVHPLARQEISVAPDPSENAQVVVSH